jgi:hypothetical protein
LENREMPPEDDFLNQMSDALITAQAIAFAACHTVREMMLDVARLHPDPERYLTGLFDRVSDRLDPVKPYMAKEMAGLARDQIGAMFRDALNTLRNARPAGPHSAGRPAD